MRQRTIYGALVLAAILHTTAMAGQAAHAQDYAIYTAGTSATGIYNALTMAGMIDALSGADVVFIGEQHDYKQGHALELEILKALHTRNPKNALSLEMFERDTQIVLDEYLAGSINETSFLQASRPWPNYKTDYRPLIEYCKEQHIPVVAANAPRRYVNIVSRKGQAALTELPKSAKAFLPPLPYAMELPPEYDRQLNEIFGSAHDDTSKAGKTSTPPPQMSGMPSTENLKQAQALWDESMKDSILRFLRANRGVKVVQMNGAMHSDSKYGIVERLRKAAPRLKIMNVSIHPDSDFVSAPTGKLAAKYVGVADFVVLGRPDPPTPTEDKTVKEKTDKK